jgi:hypothetical protein
LFRISASLPNSSADLAEEAELPFLTYLLGMVALEAEKALQDGSRTMGLRRRLW